MDVIIRENIDKYMRELETWLVQTADEPPEEMAGFFSARLGMYEDHMSVWQKAYEAFAQLLPDHCSVVLDLGCGTGLELDVLYKRYPQLHVTGVDLCQDMLDALRQKHGDKCLDVVCADYLKVDMGAESWDAVISFESLHHFFPEQKAQLYAGIHRALKPGGVFLLGDYIAACDAEEQLLQKVYWEKRKRFGIPEGQFIHFDIPLTLAHETELLTAAGFGEITVDGCIDGATLLRAWK